MALCVAAAVTALAALVAGANTSAMRLDCACTSTHFDDVSFAVTCQRNTSSPQSSDDGNTKFLEHSTVSCERGPAPPPPADYRLVKGMGYYKFHPRQTTWEDALRTCASEGANLALPNTEAEAAAMAAIFKEFPKLHEEDWLNDQAWIGATDLKQEGTFVTLAGRPLRQGYERWSEGEPNNEGGEEHCVALDRQRLFNDEPCATRLSFFCQRRLPSDARG